MTDADSSNLTKGYGDAVPGDVVPSEDEEEQGARSAEMPEGDKEGKGKEECGGAAAASAEAGPDGAEEKEGGKAANASEGPWNRREQQRKGRPARTPMRWAEEEEGEVASNVRKAVREIEDRCKSMIADQAWQTEMKTRKNTEAISKEQEK